MAAGFVARARTHGQTILVSSLGIVASNTVIDDKLPYDPAKDFAPVTQIAYSPPSRSGAWTCPNQNIQEMVAYAKANPGKINRGSPGASIPTNLAPMAFEHMAGISTTHIPFDGDARGLQALLGGQIEVHGTSITGPLQHGRAGKMRVPGVMDSQRMPQVPEAATFKEQGYDIEALLRCSLSVPAATPRDTIARMNRAVKQIIADLQFVARPRAIGMEPRSEAPEKLAKFIKTEFDPWVPWLQSLNLPKQAQ